MRISGQPFDLSQMMVSLAVSLHLLSVSFLSIMKSLLKLKDCNDGG